MHQSARPSHYKSWLKSAMERWWTGATLTILCEMLCHWFEKMTSCSTFIEHVVFKLFEQILWKSDLRRNSNPSDLVFFGSPSYAWKLSMFLMLTCLVRLSCPQPLIQDIPVYISSQTISSQSSEFIRFYFMYDRRQERWDFSMTRGTNLSASMEKKSKRRWSLLCFVLTKAGHD